MNLTIKGTNKWAKCHGKHKIPTKYKHEGKTKELARNEAKENYN